MLSIDYISSLILELMRQHSNYLRFKTSMNYHLEITKKGNCRFFFFRGRGNNILTFLFYVLNFPKIHARLNMTLSFLSSWTNLLSDGLLRSQILFM